MKEQSEYRRKTILRRKVNKNEGKDLNLLIIQF